MMEHFEQDQKSSLEGMELAQWIAFAPMVFQAARALKHFGILSVLENAKKKGVTFGELKEKLNLSHYGLRVLCEAGLGIGLIHKTGQRYFLSRAGYFHLNDEMTQVNIDFIHNVCYKGLFYLEESIKSGQPEGLKVFGNWKTFYEGLLMLPSHVQESWCRFDHFYSDGSYKQALPIVFAQKPERLLDIGGNNNKWAFCCMAYDTDVHVTILDLPSQISLIKKSVNEHGFTDRLSFVEADLLDESTVIPAGYDVIWMSQFLDCFSDDQIESILSRCSKALGRKGRIFIMETFWDNQKFKTAAFCLQMTSLYFTTIANGNSQMYSSEVFLGLIEKAGLVIEKVYHPLGVSHSLVQCKMPG